jgi:arylsulfatase A-like enzyme
MRQRIGGLAVGLSALGFLGGCATPEAPAEAPEKPNFVVVFADDMGYGDLGAFGHPVFRTPHLDQLAAEGQRWTQFYVAASVCTPSRAALLTGRYPIRSGMAGPRRVLFPDSGGGLPASEVTIAEALADAGYVSGAFGKWHLGHLPQYLPTRQGFATYWGIPYSNDMDKVPDSPHHRAEAQADPRWQANPADYDVPIIHDEEEVERPADQYTITRRYTEKAIEFIRASRDRPFFVYLAHSMMHIPIFASREFDGGNAAGLYADAIEEVDWSVGQIVATLKELGLEKRTLVVFTSDNGPWLIFDTHGGTAGLLRGGKGDTFEGGMREPTVMWGPGLLAPGVVRDMGSTLDLLPTFCALAGVEPPQDRLLDGVDLSPALRGEGKSPRDQMMFYRTREIFAARLGRFKAHFVTQSGYDGDAPLEHDPPLLYDLESDPSERFDVAARHPEALERIRESVETHRRTVEPVPDQLAIPLEP